MGLLIGLFWHMYCTRRSRPWLIFEQDAGCINMIDVDEQGFTIVRLLNYTPYNAAKQGLELTTMERYFLEFPQAQ